MAEVVQPEDVLAWMVRHRASATQAALEFGIPAVEIRRWKRDGVQGRVGEATREPPEVTETARARAEVLTLHPGGAEPEPDIDYLVDTALRLRLRWLANKESLADRGQKDHAIVVGILMDKRIELRGLSGLKEDLADLTTPEGQEAALKAIAAVPRGLIRKAIGEE